MVRWILEVLTVIDCRSLRAADPSRTPFRITGRHCAIPRPWWSPKTSSAF